VGTTGNISETCFEVEPDSLGGSACFAGSIGTMSATDPEHWPLSGGGPARRDATPAACDAVAGSSTETAKTLRHAAFGQRTS